MQLQALRGAVLAIVLFFVGTLATAAPYAAFVMDARTGEVLHSRNADTRLHPASLTKMMTLYMTFKAIEDGRLSLDQKVKISRNAASEPPSRLGLKEGQRISIRYLIRAAAVKSANDAATALGEAVSGSEKKFAKAMTAQARAIGMKNTTFKNANGLTAKGHLSTARDMSILGRRLLYDYPEYYNLFSRRTADAGLRTVPNTNRRLLANYKGADGIKTGYTNAAGFNLVSSAERGNKRIIATVFGGRTSAIRNARVAELLDMGFNRAPNTYADNVAPASPTRRVQLASASGPAKSNALTIRAPRAAANSPRPQHRPRFDEATIVMASVVRQDMEAEILAAAQANAARNAQPNVGLLAPRSPDSLIENSIVAAVNVAETQRGYVEPEPDQNRIVSRANEARGGGWSVQLGAYSTRYKAQKILLRTALADLNSLEGANRKILGANQNGRQLYRARFIGVSENSARKACARLQSRNKPCSIIPPGA
tara:strand:- start:33351 stop:34799 length:1449 start_codon:yes stop_codon:yes gene_type:complete